MPERLEQLTPEQEASLKPFAERAIADLLSTEPVGDTRDLVDAVYRAGGLEPPRRLLTAASPLGGCLLAGLLKYKSTVDQVRAQVWEQVRDQVGEQVAEQVRDQFGEQVWAQVRDQVRDQVGEQVREQVRAQFADQVGEQVWEQVGEQVWAQVADQVWTDLRCGVFDAGWVQFYEWFNEHYATNKLAAYAALSRSCHGAMFYKDVCIIIDRPLAYSFNEDGELHNESGPAIEYRDGWKVYAINGVRLPGDIIESPESITVERIKAEGNAEIKRIMRERYGDARYLQDIGATVVDMDAVPVDGHNPADSRSISRALMQDDEGARFLVGSDGSTSRVYVMRVPPTAQTCAEAHQALMNGQNSNKIILEA